MVLELKPVGRGNWAPLLMTLNGKRVLPLLVSVGQRIPIGGVVYRVCKVMP